MSNCRPCPASATNNVSPRWQSRPTSLRFPYAQRRKEFEVEWIDHMMPEDRTATPAEVATARIDIRAGLETLSRRNRAIANLLAVGKSTGETAERFGLSPGRISQLRGELRESWEKFQISVGS